MSSSSPGPPASDKQGDLRFFFAAERTMLAWVRTSVSLMALGFVVARFGLFLNELAAMSSQAGAGSGRSTVAAPAGAVPSLWVGVALISAAVLLLALAGREHARFRKSYQTGKIYEIPSISTGLVLCVALGLLGVGLAIHLVVLSH